MTKKFCDRCGKPAEDQTTILNILPLGIENKLDDRVQVRIDFRKDAYSGTQRGSVDVDLCLGCKAHLIQATYTGVVLPRLVAQESQGQSAYSSETFQQ